MVLSSAEFWGMIQVVIDICLIGLFLFVIRQVRQKNPASDPGMENTTGAVMDVLREAQQLAKKFDLQLKEKQHIIRQLNDGLDSKIIAMDVLINRADAFMKTHERVTGTDDQYRDICRLQEEIMALSDAGLGLEVVATRLGVAKKEVELVVNLRKKFEEMEKNE